MHKYNFTNRVQPNCHAEEIYSSEMNSKKRNIFFLYAFSSFMYKYFYICVFCIPIDWNYDGNLE